MPSTKPRTVDGNPGRLVGALLAAPNGGLSTASVPRDARPTFVRPDLVKTALNKFLPGVLVALLLLGLVAPLASAQEEPGLPPGLGPSEDQQEPSLPEGLGEEPAKDDEVVEVAPASEVHLPFDLNGFWETRLGARTQRDHYERDLSIGETRLQLEIEKSSTAGTFKLTTDFLYDPVFDKREVRLEEGRGWFDLREASFLLTPVTFMDLKVGRQILTWGTGDLLFINDMFPKDWNSFFIGRDEEYLKAPSDALKASLYSEAANLDLVYTPRFDADRFIDGSRVSYWNATLGRRAGRDAIVHTDKPDDWFEDDEVAWRLFKNVNGYELAAYGYYGFWKSPAGMDTVSGLATFPELSVYGASLRGAVGKGIGNVEIGYYDSRDDRSGTDPFVRNSEFRFLAGYEQEVARDFTVGVQHYLELMMEHGDYIRNLPAGSRAADEDRHVLTLRLTRLLMSQNLTLSLFTYYSPTDEDAYLRPNVHYKVDDHWSAEIGGNLFVGADDHTFFGQFEKNTNVYLAARYSF
jgi:hypothetical protein